MSEPVDPREAALVDEALREAEQAARDFDAVAALNLRFPPGSVIDFTNFDSVALAANAGRFPRGPY